MEQFCIAAGGSPAFVDNLEYSWKLLVGQGTGTLSSLVDSRLGTFREGGKWNGIWTQNYLGMVEALPILTPDMRRVHEATLDLFFKYQGNGKIADKAGMLAPDGALPEYMQIPEDYDLITHYKNDEHSGEAANYDFWVEGTATTVIMKAEFLLAEGNPEKARQWLPPICRALDWLASRRDATTGLLATGPAGTLVERSYNASGFGTMAFPSSVMVAFIGALKRCIEVARLAKDNTLEAQWRDWLNAAKQALGLLVEPEGYLASFIEKDGTRHGVLKAAKHAYFESNANCDAVAWGAVDAKLANSIMDVIASTPGLHPTPLLACVWPGKDDVMPRYQTEEWYGPGRGFHWNGAAWYSSQARYLMALYMTGRLEDAQALTTKMRSVHEGGVMRDTMDDFGKVLQGDWNPDNIGNFYIDGFGVFGAALRGLFEYDYAADGLTLTPHLPKDMRMF